MDYKVIAMDLDGTLLNDRKEISPLTAQAIMDARAAGKKIVLISGRHRREMIAYAQSLGLGREAGDYLVSCDGIYIEELSSGRISETSTLTGAETAEIVARYGCCAQTMVVTAEADYVIYEKPNASYLKRRLRNLLGKASVPVSMKELDKLKALPAVEKIVFVSADSSRLYRQLAAELGEACHLQLCSGGRLELLHRDVSKWKAIQAVSRALRIPPEEWLYFGDDGNDIQCLQNIKHSFAMGNAAEEIKNCAAYVTGSNNEDGIAAALERMDNL